VIRVGAGKCFSAANAVRKPCERIFFSWLIPLVDSVDVCWKAHYLVHVSLVLNQLAVYRHGNRGQQALPKLIIERSFLLVDVVLVTDEARKLVYDVGCEL
jgi:hypothetical protein